MIKAIVISNPEGSASLVRRAQAEGYITFVFQHVDPDRELGLRKFMYVSSDDELIEKLNLLEKDITTREEVKRW